MILGITRVCICSQSGVVYNSFCHEHNDDDDNGGSELEAARMRNTPSFCVKSQICEVFLDCSEVGLSQKRGQKVISAYILKEDLFFGLTSDHSFHDNIEKSVNKPRLIDNEGQPKT